MASFLSGPFFLIPASRARLPPGPPSATERAFENAINWRSSPKNTFCCPASLPSCVNLHSIASKIRPVAMKTPPTLESDYKPCQRERTSGEDRSTDYAQPLKRIDMRLRMKLRGTRRPHTFGYAAHTVEQP